MEIEYFVEYNGGKNPFVYRKGGDPYFAMWSYRDEKWIYPDFFDNDEMEKIFWRHDGVEFVDEGIALKLIGQKR